jgi:hypothetical protein
MLKVQTYLDIIESKNTNNPLIQSSFVDCGAYIKEEDIKEEMKQEESVDDPLTIHQEIEKSNYCADIKKEKNEVESVDDPLTINQHIENSYVCEDIKQELKEEENVDDSLSIEGETTKSENIVIEVKEEGIDIVEHKIETDIY